MPSSRPNFSKNRYLTGVAQQDQLPLFEQIKIQFQLLALCFQLLNLRNFLFLPACRSVIFLALSATLLLLFAIITA
ncbi:MAG: hypothetical protein CSH37_06295 [Thalassolituus sp.]|jgi:hypothetical protein|nr:MAG: hypothetical protein CSH37_06295 [Thalassolituus sp.]